MIVEWNANDFGGEAFELRLGPSLVILAGYSPSDIPGRINYQAFLQTLTIIGGEVAGPLLFGGSCRTNDPRRVIEKDVEVWLLKTAAAMLGVRGTDEFPEIEVLRY